MMIFHPLHQRYTRKRNTEVKIQKLCAYRYEYEYEIQNKNKNNDK